MIKISDPEEEKTKRAEERTKQVKMVVDFLSNNLIPILLATFSFGVVGGAVVVSRSNTLPCYEVKNKLDKLQLPQYYELRPFNPSQSTAPKLNIKNP